VRKVDLRYVGQSYELTLPLQEELLDLFHAEHERHYGFAAPAEPVELVALRLTTIGTITKPERKMVPPSVDRLTSRDRPVFFGELDCFASCPVYDRRTLGAGAAIAGPAVIEEYDTTILIHPGYITAVDRLGNLSITPAADTSSSD
jgi:N-methylhydantoinase A